MGIAGLGPGEGRRAKSFIPALDKGARGKDPEGGREGWEGFLLAAPPRAPTARAQMELPQQRGGTCGAGPGG